MDMRSGQTAASGYPAFFYLLIILLCALQAPCSADVSEQDYFLREKGNATLIVFIAGLGGKQTWDTMAKLMDQDSGLNGFDYLLYYSPKELTIEENVRRLVTILSARRATYREVIYVGHSIGGIMIKGVLLSELSANPAAPHLPKMAITFGTPLNLDKFSVSTFKRLGARISWLFISPLRKEVFNIERLKEINSSWRTAARKAPLKDVRTVYIFGAEDEIAPAKGEGGTDQVVFVRGDHSGIVTPGSADACSWIVFRTAVLEPETDLQTLGCTLKTPHLNGSPAR